MKNFINLYKLKAPEWIPVILTPEALGENEPGLYKT